MDQADEPTEDPSMMEDYARTAVPEEGFKGKCLDDPWCRSMVTGRETPDLFRSAEWNRRNRSKFRWSMQLLMKFFTKIYFVLLLQVRNCFAIDRIARERLPFCQSMRLRLSIRLADDSENGRRTKICNVGHSQWFAAVPRGQNSETPFPDRFISSIIGKMKQIDKMNERWNKQNADDFVFFFCVWGGNLYLFFVKIRHLFLDVPGSLYLFFPASIVPIFTQTHSHVETSWIKQNCFSRTRRFTFHFQVQSMASWSTLIWIYGNELDSGCLIRSGIRSELAYEI